MEFAIFLCGFGKIWEKEAKMVSSIAWALSESGERGGGTLFSHPHSTHHEAKAFQPLGLREKGWEWWSAEGWVFT